MEDDPFDTSKIYSHSVQQIPLQAASVFADNSNYVKSDITNRSVNFTSNSVINVKITNMATSVNLVAPQKDIAVGLENLSANSDSPQKSTLDKKLVEEFENLNLNAAAPQIPLLQPPPSSAKVKKLNELTIKNTNALVDTLQKTASKDDHMMTLNEYIAKNSNCNQSDTSSVFNKIWYQNAVVQNGNMPKVTNLIAATTSQENVSEFGQFRCNQPRLNGDNSLYSNQSAFNNTSSTYYSTSACNHYASQLGTYGSYNSLPAYRQYSEVPTESLYTEIPEYFYSQVPDETLKPHRPAPPSPLVPIGQPQSMQQIQRKLQQGQVNKK